MVVMRISNGFEDWRRIAVGLIPGAESTLCASPCAWGFGAEQSISKQYFFASQFYGIFLGIYLARGLCIIYFSVAVKEYHDQGNLEDLAWVYSSRGLCQSRPRGMAVGRHGGRNRKLSDTPRMKQRANCKFTKAVCSQSPPPVTWSL